MSRYDLVPESRWPYLSGPLRGLDGDVAALEGDVALQRRDVAYDLAHRKTDGVLQAGDLLESGHVYTVRADLDAARFKWASGALVHDIQTELSQSAAYAGVELPGPVGRVWCDFEFTGANPENVVLIASGGDRPFTQPATDINGIVGTGFTDAAAHLVLSPTTLSYGVLTGTPFGIEEIAAAFFDPPLPVDTLLTVAVDFADDTVTITSPLNGTQIVRTDARFATDDFRGPYAAIELYAGATSTPTKIMSWGAAQETPKAARVFTPEPDRTFASEYRPATQLDVAMPAAPARVSNNFNLPVVIPASGKLLVEAQLHVVQSAGTYLLGLNNGAGSGDGFQRVVTGAYNGPVTVRWLWTHPVPGTQATIYPEHFLVEGGTGTARFSSEMGYYGVLTATPVA